MAIDFSEKLPLPAEDGDIDYQLYAVAFIDIMGQRQQLNAVYSDSVDRSEARAHAQNSLIKVTRAVYRFREFFRNYFSAALMRDPLPMQHLNPESRKVAEDEEVVDIDFQRFADTVIVYMPLKNSRNFFQLRALHALLCASSASIPYLMAGDIPVRGAIELGLGAEIAPGEIYGPVMAEAYALESTIANYPRIVIGELLIDFLRDMSALPQDSIVNRINSLGAHECFNLIERDSDGVSYGDGIKVFRTFQQDSGDLDISSLFRQGYSQILKNIEKLQAKNVGVTEKYRLLKNYYDRSGVGLDN